MGNVYNFLYQRVREYQYPLFTRMCIYAFGTKLCTSIMDNIPIYGCHSYDILGVGMLWKPKEARILMNFIDQLVNIW
jgi:hypothetical protein